MLTKRVLHLKEKLTQHAEFFYLSTVSQCNYQQHSDATVTTSSTEFTKKFSDVPGPTGVFGLGTLFQYVPVIGKYRWDALHEAGFKKYYKWGSIVKETIVPGVDIIWIFDPNDIATVLNDSGVGNYPQRRSHLALEKYRKDRSHVYRTGGLLPTNGSEWWNLRSEVQKGLSSPQNVRNFFPFTDEITKEFIELIVRKRNSVTIDGNNDFLNELSRLNLELVCYMAFSKRMNSFSDKERLPDSVTSKLIESAEITNSCILPTDQGLQLWRLYETPVYRKLRRAQEFMEKVAIDLVTKREEVNDHRKSLIGEYLNNPKLKFNDIIGMASDLLLAGVDTTTYTTAFVLYHLANNKEVQEMLFKETKKILPNADDRVSPVILNNEATYTRAVLKESMRLNPISIGVGRNLNKDTTLSGYLIPKGTVIVTQNYVACRLEENFKNAESFMPERWLKSAADRLDKSKRINPYLVLPFGHGMRSCIARRFAEQNMLLLLIRLIRKYEVSWYGDKKLSVVTKLINKPDQEINLIFKERK